MRSCEANARAAPPIPSPARMLDSCSKLNSTAIAATAIIIIIAFMSFARRGKTVFYI